MPPSTTPGSFSAKSCQSPPIKQAYSGEREYLQPLEVEALIKAARRAGRHRVRDAAMIIADVSSWSADGRVSSAEMVECRSSRGLFGSPKS